MLLIELNSISNMQARIFLFIREKENGNSSDNFYSCEKILVKLPNLSSIAINPQGDYKEAQGIKILTDFI